MQIFVRITVPVHCYDTVCVFRYDFSVRIHTESTHHIVVPVGLIDQLALVHIVGNVFENFRRKFHAHPDVHAIAHGADIQLFTDL